MADTLIFLVVCVGYEKMEFKLNKTDLPISRDFLIVPIGNVGFLGEVEIIEQKKWWQFWKRKTK